MRNSLRSLKPAAHAGLALYKGLKGFEPEDKQELLEAIAKTPISPAYEAAFKRWKDALPNAVMVEATTKTPLAIGLGNSSPIENGLSIHHTYGTPYLPGSAIKGLLTRAADKHGLTKEEKKVLFGEQDEATHIVYWDGWLDPNRYRGPDPEIESPFQKDVITVHHQKYYGGRGEVWPTDFDDPNPVAFLSVKPGTKFVLALSSASEGSDPWLKVAADLLTYALANLGLGGKTNAGYGYFGSFKVTFPEKPKTPEQQGLVLLEQRRPDIEQIQKAQDLSKADGLIDKVATLEPIVRQPVLEALKAQLQKIKQWDMGKARCRKIQALLEGS